MSIIAPNFAGIWTKTEEPPMDSADAASIQEDLAPQVQWRECIEKLRRLKALGDDWDGLGATAPDSELVDDVVRFAQSLLKPTTPAPRVVATPSGSVLLEWHEDEGEYWEAEISQIGVVSWMWERPGHPTMHWESSMPTDTVGDSSADNTHDDSPRLNPQVDSSSENSIIQFESRSACLFPV